MKTIEQLKKLQEHNVENGYCEKCVYNEEAERCHECDEDFSEFKSNEDER